MILQASLVQKQKHIESLKSVKQVKGIDLFGIFLFNLIFFFQESQNEVDIQKMDWAVEKKKLETHFTIQIQALQEQLKEENKKYALTNTQGTFY